MAPRRETNSDETDASGTTATSGSTNATSVGGGLEAYKDEILPLLEPPSEEEAVGFYHGLISKPRLVGRASSGVEIWEDHEHLAARLAPDPYIIRPRKELSSIGNHPIRLCWGAVQPQILQAISGLPWTSIDVIRIGFEGSPRTEKPVVVWVGVDNTDIPWDVVAKALRDCRKVLDREDLDLTDVDCQIRVSTVRSLAGLPLLSPYGDKRPEGAFCVNAQPFSTAIGQSIFPFASLGLQGTLGVYIGPAKVANGPVWALTCRHVALPSRANLASQPYRRKNVSQLPLRIGLPGETLQNREIGSVFYSPPIGLGRCPGPSQGEHTRPWTRDWSLVELMKDKFSNGSRPTNMVDLRTTTMKRPEVTRLLNPHVRNTHKFTFPANGLLHLSGFISLQEMYNPVTLDAAGEECFIVGKRGATTGLTWGSPSELESTVRKCLPNGGEFVSYEWAVHGSLQGRNVPFSKPGDSGAAVFGIDGRLGGLLTRGTGNDRAFKVDISYVTPVEPLFMDIEKELGCAIKLL